MKTVITSGYVFTPATRRMDFTGFAGFDIRRLYAIIDQTANQIIYAESVAGYGLASQTGSILTLQYDTTALSGSDALQVIYDDPNVVQKVDGSGVTQPVSIASVPLPVGAATSANQTNGNQITQVSNFPSTQAVTGTFWQTVQPISGTVAVSNFPLTQAVTGTFWQTTQPVSVASLPLPSGAATSANQTNGNQVTQVSNFPLTQAVTGTFWQTTQPVSGTVSISGSVAVTGTFWQATQPVSGTVTANAGTGTFQTNVTNASIPVTQSGPWTVSLVNESIQIGTVDQGTAAALSGAWPVEITDGTNVLGTSAHPIRIDPTGTTTQPVSGTFWQATQPISGTVAISGAVNQGTAGVSPWLENLTQVGGVAIALGQAAMTASLPVVIASNQSTLNTSDAADGPVAPGAAASKSQLMGGQYSSSLPVATTGQQVALQLDANGRVIISPTQSISISPVPAVGAAFRFGRVQTSASTTVPVEFTAYTETTTNSAMTLVSASADDTSAGIGARTVTVTYLDQTGAGPYTTTFTMNGTSAVTAGVSNMCFVESIIVSTVGSTGSNVGILTLKTGGGATVGTIGATTNTTLWSHHYVPNGKICFITSQSIGNNASSAGAGSTVALFVSNPTVANSPNIQVSDFINVSGGSNTIVRTYAASIQVVGPARVRSYLTPGATSTYTTYAAFDFVDY